MFVFELLTFGSLGFWVILALEIIILGFTARLEKFMQAFISLICFFGLISIFGSWDTIKECFSWIYSHPLQSIGYFFLYFFIGMIYVINPFFGKWKMFVVKIKDKNKEIYKDWLDNNERYKADLANGRASYVQNAYRSSWEEYEDQYVFVDDTDQKVYIKKPTPEMYKSRIIGWIAYWPIFFAITLLTDPFRKIGELIYMSIRNILQRIANKAWED